VELQSLRDGRLGRKADLRVGLALVDLYDRRLAEPGKAMAELRRLIDRHPEDQGIRRLRHHLAALKSEQQARTDPTADGVVLEPDSEP
jgi:hypothetical protein